MSSYAIPNVVAQNPRGERIMDVYSHLLTQRIVYLGTAIDSGVANALIGQLLHLDSDNPDSGIDLYINCEGGDPGAMLAVYDTMQFIRPAVATTRVGQAVAAGAVLLAGGAPGRRTALAHARVILHQPVAQGPGNDPRLDLAGRRGGARACRYRGGSRTPYGAVRLDPARRYRPRSRFHGIRCPRLWPDRSGDRSAGRGSRAGLIGNPG
ncbi:ClpP family protease [Microbacterium schleiferi]|uniref:ClpP family protease n=1 Tax=Microbacterium schleiferi TaxID=69362 RepID=UPI003CCA256F